MKKPPADPLGDRMKLYENVEAGRRFIPLIPIVARMDGRGFHNFTKGLKRPFDPLFSQAMVQTTIRLVKETCASMGYTQSDEITLVWHSEDIKQQIWFDGRVTKMVSQLAAQTTMMFYRQIETLLPAWVNKEPTFDARVWQVPNQTEAANVLIWREQDATKNSISMAAHNIFSNEELHKMSGPQKQEMLWQKGTNWNDYPTEFKRGTYVQRRTTTRKFAIKEKTQLPKKHAVHTNPNLKVTRAEVKVLPLPPLTQIANQEAVIFQGARPKTKKK